MQKAGGFLVALPFLGRGTRDFSRARPSNVIKKSQVAASKPEGGPGAMVKFILPNFNVLTFNLFVLLV